MTWITIVKAILVCLASVITTGIPAFIALRKAWAARKVAETAAAKEKADADLLATAKSFIAAAEVAFDGFDKMLKSQGSSAGAMKKDTVFNKLQAYALQNEYEFDAAEWSERID